MEDKRSIKKVLESQGDVHEKVENQSNSELPSSSPTRSSGLPRIQIDVQIAYDLRFGRSTYGQKAKGITFPIGTYHDYVNCDVVPMQACSLLLGHPWEFDTNAIHHGRSNKYTLVHNRKKITLLPLTPNKIVQCDRAIN
jgi:hypothetical protein